MKTVALIDSGNFKAKALLPQVLDLAPGGANLGEMRRRANIANAIEQANGKLALEDADFDLFKGIVERFPFQTSTANKDQIAVLTAAITPLPDDPPPPKD